MINVVAGCISACIDFIRAECEGCSPEFFEANQMGHDCCTTAYDEQFENYYEEAIAMCTDTYCTSMIDFKQKQVVDDEWFKKAVRYETVAVTMFNRFWNHGLTQYDTKQKIRVRSLQLSTIPHY